MGVESLTFARRRARRLYVRVRLAEVRVWSPDAAHVQINGRVGGILMVIVRVINLQKTMDTEMKTSSF